MGCTHLEVLGHADTSYVSGNGDLAPTLEREAPHGLCPEAVARSTDPGDALGFEGQDDLVDNGAPGVDAVLGEPCRAVEVLGGFEGVRVALEDVRHDRAVAI